VYFSCDRVTNPNPTDLKHKIRIRRIRSLAGSVTSLPTDRPRYSVGNNRPHWHT